MATDIEAEIFGGEEETLPEEFMSMSAEDIQRRSVNSAVNPPTYGSVI
jgi:hypothetical protein